MQDEEKVHQIVRDELGNRGYVVNVQARREGDVVVGHVHVTSAETDETVAKIVGAGKMETLNMSFGLDIEGTLRDVLVKAFSTWQGMQNLIPAVVLKPKP
ncbi:MAG: hypothetical protein AABY30_04870 [Candidatus Thermoplasmatota archaeon]